MTPAPSAKTAEHCLKRADSMRLTAEQLLESGDEWFAVCYFYAAYQTVRAALVEDPLFASLAKLEKVRQVHRLSLTMEDRFVERHKGRVAGAVRSVGVNDLVRALYPQINVQYLQLHGASVDVRYNSGLSATDRSAVASGHADIAAAYAAGSLQAVVPS